LITWPTVVAPLQNIGLALTRGPQLSNAQPVASAPPSDLIGRYVMRRPMSETVAEYIREQTPVDARILSQSPTEMSIATGRPNASAYSEFVQFVPVFGPEYLDAIRYLEPLAVRRLGASYVHASDDWVASLPEHAQRWLEDPALFNLLIRDGVDALFRVRPAFLDLETTPPAESFEGLRQAVRASSTVYLSPSLEPVNSIRAAVVLSHTRLLGQARPTPTWHSRPHFPTEPLGDHTPDLIVTSARLAPSAFPLDKREPIWWNDEIAIYPLGRAANPIMPPPSRPFSVELSDVQAADGRIAFTATFSDREPDEWKGQDWLVTSTDDSPWAIPREFEADERRRSGSQWFGGQVVPGRGVTTYRFEFDPRMARLDVRNADGSYARAPSSGAGVEAGTWTLAARLRGDWWELAYIPLMSFTVSNAGEVSYKVYEGTLGAALIP